MLVSYSTFKRVKIQDIIYLHIGSWDSAVTGSRQSGSALACASMCQHAEAQASLCNAFRWDEDTGTCHIAKVTSWPHGIMGRRFPDGGLLSYRK